VLYSVCQQKIRRPLLQRPRRRTVVFSRPQQHPSRRRIVRLRQRPPPQPPLILPLQDLSLATLQRHQCPRPFSAVRLLPHRALRYLVSLVLRRNLLLAAAAVLMLLLVSLRRPQHRLSSHLLGPPCSLRPPLLLPVLLLVHLSLLV
ncbi:hypothetical protein FOZ63_010643, partial [Perkinsus olseni]